MPNLLGLAGGQAQKQTRFAPIYNGRWSSGIWTNRSPLRDATTTRIVEKYYGAAGDALIAGSNVEITNKLTLARRPGNPVYDNNSWNDVDSFYDFRLFNQTEEQIYLMVDEANALFSLFNSTKTTVFTKSTNGGQSYMQSVGNSLYFGNGVDQKKWLQSLVVWQAGFNWIANAYPAFTTFLIDTNGNIQQLTTPGTSAGTTPAWSTVVPSAGNDFQGGLTTDGSAIWTNRGNPVENWGIQPPTTAVSPVVGSSRVAWVSNTFYSLVSVVIDSNGNLQQVTTAGKTGASTPTWQTSVGLTTTDGTAVWTMIQTAASMVWTANTAYAAGHFIIGNASGTNSLFQLTLGQTASLNSNVAAYIYPQGPTAGSNYQQNPTSLGSATESFTTLSSLQMTNFNTGSGFQQIWSNLNGAGASTGTTNPFPTILQDEQMIVLGSFEIPIAGQYAFQIISHDGFFWGIGDGAQLISGTNINPLTGAGYPQTVTANMGFPVFGGNNNRFEDFGFSTNNFVINFPTAGTYRYEIDWSFWFHQGMQLNVTCNGNVIPFGTAISGATEPVWPVFTQAFAPAYATVTESSGQYVWENLGPTADFVRPASANVTLPDTTIIDPAGNTEGPFRTGVSGLTQPTFATGLNQLTLDNPNLIWINQGPAAAPPSGSVSTFNGGWIYTIALVNTLDQTISNAAPLSVPTGNFIGAAGVTIPAGSGLNPSTIDPQADYVAIFRTTDGQDVPFLIPNSSASGLPFNTTISLAQYLTSGYTDTTPDVGLNNLIEAPIAGENTPPALGAINLTYHLSRLFYSIGNVVYWTDGPDAPSGNGINGGSLLNTDSFPSLVKCLVPTTSGLVVFTVSDIYIIQGAGTTNSPITSGIVLLQGVGVSSYNAVGVNGSVLGFFTTDSQFVIIDPSSGVSYAGFPLGDQMRLDNGGTGTSWNPASVYVTWHVDGEDQAWYVSDGAVGWFRLMPTPSPETGYTWSPFATIVGGAKAVQGIEVAPGDHRLLLGPTGTGPILNRDLSSSQDSGTSFPANAVLGSMVLAQPGQVAAVSFITTEAVRIGTPFVLGVIFDEALPYYTGSFDVLKHSVNDPPTLKPSKSLIAQRFYMSDSEEEALCRHMQVKIDFGTQSVQNEILSLTVYGAYYQES
jgi:hypothetical protein